MSDDVSAYPSIGRLTARLASPVHSPPPAASVLIVGAGCVGQVLANHLVRSGASVSFVVRPGSLPGLVEQGFCLRQLDAGSDLEAAGHLTASLPGADVLDPGLNVTLFPSVAEALAPMAGDGGDNDGAPAATHYDYVISTLPTDAHRGPDGQATPFYRGLLEAILPASDTVIVGISAMPEEAALLRTFGFPDDRIIDLGITFLAWPAPLPGERFEGCPPCSQDPEHRTIAYAIAQGLPASSPGGRNERVAAFAALLSSGGLSCKVVDSACTQLVPGENILGTLLMALELSDWSFEKLMSNAELRETTCRAISERLAIGQQSLADKPGWSSSASWTFWIGAQAFRFVLGQRFLWVVAKFFFSWFTSFDMEAYLRYHFTKVGPQMFMYVKSDLDLAASSNLPTENLDLLYNQLKEYKEARGIATVESRGQGDGQS
ncbi:hypothetical protein H696_02256 [Fonticula alba]|uniref:Ketopantoate reductase N-terminal domain-containing protein n=1 Tax=Fonticula alba TaxID=691883 RepID=A0A058ZAF9_FONAL|nr:hypothetical protein H696_02256 [Fonticula alba]KCV71310.1 hypothetical protein H696_02256 [Fonticula alba]|eukprot:XP_009494433.1 hypothetical protein H696_02256 [Fonticula alba]